MTKEQLAIKILSKLGVHDRGTPAPEDLQNALDAYEGMYYQLSDESLTAWGYADDIPTRFHLPLVTLVAAEIADFYHVSAPAEGWERTKLIVKNTLRKQLASGQETEPVTAEYF